jgi:hypothetical protein
MGRGWGEEAIGGRWEDGKIKGRNQKGLGLGLGLGSGKGKGKGSGREQELILRV